MPQLGLGSSLRKIGGVGRTYVKDGLKLYMPYRGSDVSEVDFVGTGSTSFDGDNDYVSLGATSGASDLAFTSSTGFTISAWVNFTENGAGSEYIFSNNSATNYSGVLVYKGDTGEMKILWGDNTGTGGGDRETMQGAIQITPGKWTHVAITTDFSLTTTNTKIYIDGVADTVSNTGTAGVTTPTYTSGTAYIGRWKTTYADCNIKNMAVWNRELTATEVQNVMYKSYEEVSGRLASGLVSWWALDSSTDTYDDSTGNNDGTNSGSTLQDDIYGGDTPVKPRAIDNAPTVQVDAIGAGSAGFTASNADYITMGDVAAFSDVDGFSISFWVKFDAVAGDLALITKHADYADVDNAGEFYIINDDGICEFVVLDHTNSASIGTKTGTVFVANQWYHVACTHDGGTASSGALIYIDGVLQAHNANATGSGFANINDTAQEFRVGAFTDDGEPFDGNICQVGFWSAVLTQARIQSVMEKTYEELTASEKTNLVSYWALDVGENENTTKHYTVADSMSTFGDNLLADGDAGSDNWTNDTGGTNPAPTNEKSSEYAKEGTYSRKFVIDGSSDAIHTPTFTTESSAVYQVSFWIRPSVTSINFYAYQGDGSGTNTTASENGSSTTWLRSFTANEWNKITTYYTESSGGSSAYLEFESPGSSADQTHYIDEVKVRKVLTGNFGELI